MGSVDICKIECPFYEMFRRSNSPSTVPVQRRGLGELSRLWTEFAIIVELETYVLEAYLRNNKSEQRARQRGRSLKIKKLRVAYFFKSLWIAMNSWCSKLLWITKSLVRLQDLECPRCDKELETHVVQGSGVLQILHVLCRWSNLGTQWVNKYLVIK